MFKKRVTQKNFLNILGRHIWWLDESLYFWWELILLMSGDGLRDLLKGKEMGMQNKTQTN